MKLALHFATQLNTRRVRICIFLLPSNGRLCSQSSLARRSINSACKNFGLFRFRFVRRVYILKIKQLCKTCKINLNQWACVYFVLTRHWALELQYLSPVSFIWSPYKSVIEYHWRWSMIRITEQLSECKNKKGIINQSAFTIIHNKTISRIHQNALFWNYLRPS